MVTYDRWVKKRILVTVRTYPVPSRKSVEVSCTAGITDDGNWIRLFPVPYRFLDADKRFTKYQYIEAYIAKAESDTRPESHKLNIESIKILPEFLPTDDKWSKRKDKIFPLKSDSLCTLQTTRDSNGFPTLGFFKPRTITSFKIEPCKSQWDEPELISLRQYSMFGEMPKNELLKLPYNFSYIFKCDNPSCKTQHELMCTDWEMGASYWSWRRKYGSNWETKFRERYETDMILGKDTHFFVGTLNKHPSEWIIIGLFYPPK